jgi:hypothetical protein
VCARACSQQTTRKYNIIKLFLPPLHSPHPHRTITPPISALLEFVHIPKKKKKIQFERTRRVYVSRMQQVLWVLDFRIAHERWGSSSDLSLNGHLHYPNELYGPLNEATTDKIRQYHTDYNNRPSHTISLIPTIGSTSGCLHCQFVCHLFFQDDRETDRFTTSGVQLTKSNQQYHYRRVVFSSHLKSKVDHILG